MPSLKVTPQRILVDDTPIIKCSDLARYQNVTLVSLLECPQRTYIAHAFYQANKDGNIFNTCTPSTGGTFTGIEPNGLFWSAHAAKDLRQTARLRIKDVTAPLHTILFLIDGHVDVKQAPSNKHNNPYCDVILQSCILDRLYMADHVIRQPVHVGRLRGTLFIPNNGIGKSAGVLDLFGNSGGLSEYRASLLASRGFCAMALAYFDYDDLQKDFSPLRLEYFEEAINFLATHPSVVNEEIGMVGVSHGAALSLYMSILCKKVKAVVAIASYYSNVNAYYTYKDQVFDVAFGNYENMKIESHNEINFSQVFFRADNIEKCTIPIEKSKNADYLFICGTDDQNTDCRSTALLAQRLKDHGKSNFEVHMYENAGHLIEPPYSPLCRASYNGTFDAIMIWGGEVIGHARAQEDHWRHLLRFLNEKLLSLKSIPSKVKSCL